MQLGGQYMLDGHFVTRAKTERVSSALRVHYCDLEIKLGPDRGRALRVEQPSFVIGTGPSADLCLTDDSVSREHLRLTLTGSGVRVSDQGSTNGTWIGSMRLTDALLTQSTSIQMGDTVITLTLGNGQVDLPLSESARFGEAIGESSVMRHLFALLERAAQSDVSVLIEGESGVGKDILARAIHERSRRARGPFVALDCASISPNLIESELFGHERGAFTGAERSREGAFVLASGGTLFLDEIGELPVELQPKLLRAIETRQIKPVGGRASRYADVRIVAATNKKLAEAARRQEFRRDLFYRLAVACVSVPPLRERKEDILPIARAFLAQTPGFETTTIPADFEAMLLAYPWPGNVRELRNVIARYTVFGTHDALMEASVDRSAIHMSSESPDDLSHLPYAAARAVALQRFERAYLPAVLARAGHVVVRAAELAEVQRGSFHRMLHRSGATRDLPPTAR